MGDLVVWVILVLVFCQLLDAVDVLELVFVLSGIFLLASLLLVDPEAEG